MADPKVPDSAALLTKVQSLMKQGYPQRAAVNMAGLDMPAATAVKVPR